LAQATPKSRSINCLTPSPRSNCITMVPPRRLALPLFLGVALAGAADKPPARSSNATSAPSLRGATPNLEENATLAAAGSGAWAQKCFSTPYPYVQCSADSQCRNHGLGHAYCNQWGHCSCYDMANVAGRSVRQCYDFPLQKCVAGYDSRAGGQVKTLPDWQIPGYGLFGACGQELDRCYQFYGFRDGECSCNDGGTWYSWVCRNAWSYGGCSSDCTQGCPDDRRR